MQRLSPLEGLKKKVWLDVYCIPLSFLRSQYKNPFSQFGPRLSLRPVSDRLGNTDVTPEPANSTLVAGPTLLTFGIGVEAVGFRCGATE